MIPGVLAAATAGLVGSPHCVGMCGGFATSSAMSAEGALRDAAAWHAGRMTTYAGLGAFAGAIGTALPVPDGVLGALAMVWLLWFSARLAGLVPEGHLKIPGLARLSARFYGRAGAFARYAFGLTTGLLPCGLVYAALGIPVALGDPAWGALAMVAFGVGTTPALAFASGALRRLTATKPAFRRVIAAGVLAAGAYTVVLRDGAFAAPDASGPACHEDMAH